MKNDMYFPLLICSLMIFSSRLVLTPIRLNRGSVNNNKTT